MESKYFYIANCITAISFCCVTHFAVQNVVQQSFEPRVIAYKRLFRSSQFKALLQYKSATQQKFHACTTVGYKKINGKI